MIAQRPPLSMGRAAAVVAATGAVAAGVWVLRTFDPNAADSPLPKCVFHVLTGLYCPGCGMTRALHALAHGDPASAFAMNPLLVLSLPLLLWMAWHGLGRRPAMPAALSRVLMDGKVWIGLLLVFGVMRNLPWAPFAWMAPG